MNKDPAGSRKAPGFPVTIMTTITLDPTQFDTLKAELAKRGEQDENPFIFEALHDAAYDATHQLLAEHGIHDEIDDEQLENLQLAYKDGFWEPTHVPERETLKALAQHVLAMADDAYLVGHPEWLEIVTEARAAMGE